MLGGMNYALEPWHDFAVTAGGLAGAPTGLLFVSLSIKGAALDASLALRSRAGTIPIAPWPGTSARLPPT
jgi:hypothetical protein